MAAYTALVSLSKVIDLIMSQDQAYVHLCRKEQMMSLHEKVASLQQLLEELSGRSHTSIDVLESRIRDVAYRMEDIIEEGMINIEHDIQSSLCETFTSLCMRILPVAITPTAFGRCAREIGILLEEAMRIKEFNLQEKDTSGALNPLTTASSSSEEVALAKLDLDVEPIEIMDRVFRRVSKLEIVPITGMGGIGKTTLARAVYKHPKTPRHFDIYSWVTVSQEYNVKQILRGLLPSDQQSTPDERLIEFVHKRLIGRRYLIVLDDMWDVKAWDRIRNAFPDDNKGSRIILTTRLLDVARRVGSSDHVHEMQFLDNEQSWDLLQEKVGGYELWPKKLEDLGRRISRNCRGLPLAVVAMAGLLKFNMTEEYWQRIARDTKSETAANYDHLFGVLALSYTNLPPYLKACFLYLGSYREDHEIPTDELVRLWMAEGFLKPGEYKEMEEVAEEYLEELVARSLVLVKKMRHNGRIKTCSLHDVVRELSLRIAQQEKIFQHITRSSSWMDRYSTNDMRRAIVDAGCFSKELFHHTHLRSLRCIGYAGQMSGIQYFRLVRVLGGQVCITREPQLSILYELANLRYLHIFVYSQGDDLPLTFGESISKLKNLETLIFSGTGYDGEEERRSGNTLLLPSEIWEMSCLRHLILVEGSKLLCPATLGQINCSSLQTLTKVTNLDLTSSVTAKLSNLKKLKLYYNINMADGKVDFYLNNLVHLHRLEELSVVSGIFTKLLGLSFPRKLRKLSLMHTRVHLWNMSLLGTLPNLEVLKLYVNSFFAEEWEPIEGEFVQLKYLKMEKLMLKEWRVEREHFPQLETLIIKSCKWLKEVPAGIGEIDTLQKLVLNDCKAAEESVREIKAEQESLCNDLLEVTIV